MRVIIVGGVAGGASAAARLRRLDERAEIVVYERGEHVSFANCGLPYHVGGVIADRDALLLQTPASLRARFALDVKVRHEVTAIDAARKVVTVRDLTGGATFEDRYDHLVLSPGARPIVPPIPGADGRRVLTLRAIPDMDRIIAAARGAKAAVVVGGGYIGVEMAEALVERGLRVTLVEMAEQILTFLDPDLVALPQEEMARRGVDLRLGDRVASFTEGAGLTVGLSSGATVEADLAILAIGVAPESELARAAGLRLGPTGGIAVDGQMRTSDPSIYAVGDAVEVTHLVTGRPARLPLAGPANRQGRIAAGAICGRPAAYHDTQGTAIIKIFGLACAATGANSAQLRAAGIPFRTATVHPGSHAGYYPGAQTVHLKVLYAPGDGRLLGAQACGADGADKRIDVLATAIRHRATVFDLEDYELAYAPPYGSAKDPVNMAGFVAGNDLRGDAPLVDVDHLDEAIAAGALLLDVRSDGERRRGAIEGAVGIPVDDLRARLGELPRDRPIVIYCAVGFRGYVAQRILLQEGLRASNLTGGFVSYRLRRLAEARRGGARP